MPARHNPHGTRARWRQGCRCDPCIDANRVYERGRPRNRTPHYKPNTVQNRAGPLAPFLEQHPTLVAALRHLFDHICHIRKPLRTKGRAPRAGDEDCRHISAEEHELIGAWSAAVVDWHLYPERHRAA